MLASGSPSNGLGVAFKWRRERVQIDGCFFQIPMSEQNLNGAQIRSRFQQMRGEAVAQGVGMNLITDSGSSSRLPASRPSHFGADVILAGVPAVAGEKPGLRSARQSIQMVLKFQQQFRTEHDIAVFPAFPALDVDHHSVNVHVRNFEAR